MVKHNFKIGDKVKVCETSRWKKRIRDVVGRVTKINIGAGYIYVKWETDGCITCGVGNECMYPVNTSHHKPSEIEHVVKKGEQLLFSFMD